MKKFLVPRVFLVLGHPMRRSARLEVVEVEDLGEAEDGVYQSSFRFNGKKVIVEYMSLNNGQDLVKRYETEFKALLKHGLDIKGAILK